MIDVKVPKMGMSTVEVDLMKWLVAPGQKVEAGAILAEVESEKTTLEIEAEVAGTIAEILVAEGTTVEVGTVLCRIAQNAA
jgi:pyruvate/2-oxoglutarate dehydrogenase complex dihydrolipoamide acyltransferase (E2) component